MTLLGGHIPSQAEDQVEDLGPISTKHLLVWAYQIAKGMEYLSSMKVVIVIGLLFIIFVDTPWRLSSEKCSPQSEKCGEDL